MSTFTDTELAYLGSQRIGRLATVAPDATPQNNPVGFWHNQQTDTIDIGGLNMGASRKFRNVEQNGHVAFVVDDVVSTQPWQARGIEIRGRAEALRGVSTGREGLSTEIIRIHARRILSWGIDGDMFTIRSRDVR